MKEEVADALGFLFVCVSILTSQASNISHTGPTTTTTSSFSGYVHADRYGYLMGMVICHCSMSKKGSYQLGHCCQLMSRSVPMIHSLMRLPTLIVCEYTHHTAARLSGFHKSTTNAMRAQVSLHRNKLGESTLTSGQSVAAQHG